VRETLSTPAIRDTIWVKGRGSKIKTSGPKPPKKKLIFWEKKKGGERGCDSCTSLPNLINERGMICDATRGPEQKVLSKKKEQASAKFWGI